MASFNRSVIPLLMSAVSLAACGGGSSPVVRPTQPPVPQAPPPSGGGDPADFRTTEFAANWGLAAINAEYAYADGYAGDGIIIGMVDFGFDFSFPDLNFSSDSRGRVQRNVRIYEAQIGEEAPDGFHGMSVASVAAAVKNDSAAHGVAFDATVLAVDYFSGVNSYQIVQGGITYTVSDAWTWLYQQGARVANKSIGYDEDDIIENPPQVSERYVVDYDTNFVLAGGLLVSSAGNNSDPEPSLSNLDALQRLADAGQLNSGNGAFIIVGAVDQNLNMASFSDRAGAGDSQNHFMVAPGVSISFSHDNGTDGYGVYTASGTSFAAPIVTGAAAIIMQRWPSLTAREVRGILFDSATDLGAAGVDAVFGHGLLNLEAALMPVGTTTVATPVASNAFAPGQVAITTGGAFGDAPALGSWLSQTMVLDGYGRDFKMNLSGRMQSSALPITVSSLLENKRSWQSATLAVPGGAWVTSGTRVDVDRRDRPWMFTQYEQGLPIATDLTFEMAFSIGNGEVSLGKGRSLAAALAPTRPEAAPDRGWSLLREHAGEPAAYGSLYMASNRQLSSMRLAWGFSIKEVPYGDAHDFLAEGPARDRTMQAAFRLDSKDAGWNWFASAGLVREEGSVLGSRSRGLPGLGVAATSVFMRTGMATSSAGPFTAGFEFGVWITDPDASAGVLLDSAGWMVAGSARAWLDARGVFARNDRLSLSINQPLRLEYGQINAMTAASFNHLDEQIIWEERSLSLAPSGREIGLEASWTGKFGRWEPELRMAWRRDAGHVRGQTDRAVMIYLSHRL